MIVHVVAFYKSKKINRKNWAFIRGIYISFFVPSVRDYYNAPHSDGNDQMIILRSKLPTGATRHDWSHWEGNGALPNTGPAKEHRQRRPPTTSHSSFPRQHLSLEPFVTLCLSHQFLMCFQKSYV